MKISRRVAGRMILGAPAFLAGAGLAGALVKNARADAPTQAAPAKEPDPEPTPLAKFIAKEEDGLSGSERDKVRKDVTQLEGALKAVRDFVIPNDVPPAGGFRPMRSVRKGR